MIAHYRIQLSGAVQGVGFRPFVYRIATALGLCGHVANTKAGVCIDVEGPAEKIDIFRHQLQDERPPGAIVAKRSTEALPPSGLDHGYPGFQIAPSVTSDRDVTWIMPDMAMCDTCREELLDPSNRRYRYPFISCMHCGPRYSIVQATPYDRHNTTMHAFPMCEACHEEYTNPLNRRFHAQPIACWDCGPQLSYCDHSYKVLAEREDALQIAVACIRQGGIVAVKSIGGFQLMCRADDHEVIGTLRSRKQRVSKPFAVMVRSLEQARTLCEVSPKAGETLMSWQAPIVLLPKGEAYREHITDGVAPGSAYLGIMKAYTPLHELILAELKVPLVATSANIAEDPLCYRNDEVTCELARLADGFLLHDREIENPVDDSVVMMAVDQPTVLRRARGYVPLPLPGPDQITALAFGGDLKNTTAIAHSGNIWLSPHQGDMASVSNQLQFQENLVRFPLMTRGEPEVVVHDAHPDYHTTNLAKDQTLPTLAVQHHKAHAWSCIGELGLSTPVLAVVWDGTGFGDDGSIWGGEWFLIEGSEIQRVAHLRAFGLPGGEQAIREPRRSALSLLVESFGDDLQLPEAMEDAFSPMVYRNLVQMLTRGLHCPRTTSVGRLFDAIAALCGLCQINLHEGMAAAKLEAVARESTTESSYSFELQTPANEPMIVDWQPMLEAILQDLSEATPVSLIAKQFHNTLASMVVEVASGVGVRQIAFSGGCFQNATLCQIMHKRLHGTKHQVFFQRRVPPNDGGLAYGQIWAAAKEVASCV
jgi:hydrogenase maturation protein HypF